MIVTLSMAAKQTDQSCSVSWIITDHSWSLRRIVTDRSELVS